MAVAALGKRAEAFEEIERTMLIVQQTDPHRLVAVHATRAQAYYFGREFERAIEECEKAQGRVHKRMSPLLPTSTGHRFGIITRAHISAPRMKCGMKCSGSNARAFSHSSIARSNSRQVVRLRPRGMNSHQSVRIGLLHDQHGPFDFFKSSARLPRASNSHEYQ